MKSKNKIVLAYSGGLDTSIILKWLQENYNAEVICYTADVGQEIDRKKIFKNAKKFGVKNIIIQDLKDTFVKVGKKGKKQGTGPYTEKQSMRSKGLKLVNKGIALGGAAGDAMFDKGDELVTKARKGTVLDRVIKKSTVGGKKLK